MQNNTTKKAILVSHTHWDRAWYLTFEEYRYRLISMIDRIIDMLNNDDDFKCFVLDGQTVLIEDYLEIHPDNKYVLKELIEKKRLIIGPWYVLPDLFLVSPESIIRNLQVGNQMASEFGSILDVGYVPDPFGHIAQLPQILNEFEISTFIFMRGMPKEVSKNETLLFNWIAPNGSKVLAYNTKDGYLNSTNLGYEKEIGRFDLVEPNVDEAQKRVDKTVSNLSQLHPHDLILLNNGIDHMPEQPEVPELISKMNENENNVHIEHGSFSDFMNEARKKGTDTNFIGDLLGNEDHPILLNVYSTRTYLKQQNQKAQYLLEKIAEPMSVIKNELTDKNINKSILAHAWKKLLRNHPHDDICGCSADGVHDDNEVYFRHVNEHAENIFLDTLEELTKIGFENSKSIATKFRSRDVFLFNPHPFELKKWIDVTVVFPNFKGEEEEILPERLLKAYNSNGEELEIEVTSSEAPFLKAEFVQFTWGRKYDLRINLTVPPLGYKVIKICETNSKVNHTVLDKGETVIETKNYSLTWNSTLISVFDKRNKTNFKNFIQFEYVQDSGDTYSFSQASKEIYSSLVRVESGDHSESIKAIFSISIPKELDSNEIIDTEITVNLDLSDPNGTKATIDYDNKCKNGRLRLLFPIGFETSQSYADGHFLLNKHIKI
jgi:mannosylglycerate hydrolase